MVSTSLINPGKLFNVPTRKKTLNDIRNSGYGKSKERRTGTTNTSVITYEERRASQKKAWNDAYKKKKSSSQSGQTGSGTSSSSSSGSNITTLNDAASDVSGGGDGSYDGTSGDGSEDGSENSSGSVSPLLQGEMSFEELIGEICKGIDLIFATKRSVIVVTDYASIYADAKYLRDKNPKAVEGEDIRLWQLEEGTYELDVAEYGFYNTVKVHYKNGTVTESYEDLVKVYGNVTIEYDERGLDKTTAIMKAKAYLAAHVRDFDMSIKANILWDGDIDVGDIVTIENPMTMRDHNRTVKEKRDSEYYFVMGKNIEWEGDQPITGTLELRYGAESPEQKDVPESGAGYSGGFSSSTYNEDVDQAIQTVAKKYSGYGYCHTCQTGDCAKQHKCADCYGMSDLLYCELSALGIEAKIVQYPSSYAQSGTHRSVLYRDNNGNWTDFPYRKYGFNSYFNSMAASKKGKRIKGTCD